MRILGIETSCDETSLAVVEAEGKAEEPSFHVLENLVASQINVHRPFGGVVPNLAAREHKKNLPILWQQLKKTFSPSSIELIAVTTGPGLEPALWRGIEFAEQLGKEYGIEVFPTNHLHGHMWSFLIPSKDSSKTLSLPEFPAVQLIVSGGHTTLILMENLTEWEKLGETRDDAAGEAFDKVARLLGLPYPGGPEIQKAAERGNPEAIAFPRPMMNSGDYDFSFSGLKTAVLYFLREQGYDPLADDKIPETLVSDVAASFQEAVAETLTAKTMQAAESSGARSVIISGGVAANTPIRNMLEGFARSVDITFHSAPMAYHGDNAAMIAAAAYIERLSNVSYPLKADGNLDV